MKNEHEQSPITLVTAYFRIKRKDESSVRPYEDWMANFLSGIRWPLVVFCEEQSLDTIKQLRGDKPAVYCATRWEELVVQKYRSVIQTQCLNTSVTFEASMIWHEKSHFLQRAGGINPFRSERLFWCDIGYFKTSSLSDMGLFRLSERIEWPNLRVCRSLPRDKVAFVAKNYPSRLPQPAQPQDGRTDTTVIGGFFGGSAGAVARWSKAYYQCLDRRVSEGADVCVDEDVANEVCATRPELVHVIPRSAVSWGRTGSPTSWSHFAWYYLNGGGFPLGYLSREIFQRMGNVQFVKWMLLCLVSGRYKLNWKALWPFGGKL